MVSEDVGLEQLRLDASPLDRKHGAAGVVVCHSADHGEVHLVPPQGELVEGRVGKGGVGKS